jgi:hypothetical protein
MAANIAWLKSALNIFMNGVFYLLGLFPGILIFPFFQRICYLFLCCNFFLRKVSIKGVDSEMPEHIATWPLVSGRCQCRWPLTGMIWTASRQDFASKYYKLRSSGWHFLNLGQDVESLSAISQGVFLFLPAKQRSSNNCFLLEPLWLIKRSSIN